MAESSIADILDAMLEEGFRGSEGDFVDALADDDVQTTEAEIARLLASHESVGSARKSPCGQWYRPGKLIDATKVRRGVSGREIGSFARRLVYVPELSADSFVLLTLREGTGAFRIRTYDANNPKPRMIPVKDANNDVVQFERLYGPLQHDIWWDDADVKSVENVTYWVGIIRQQNARYLAGK